MTDLEIRIARLEDREETCDVVTRYCTTVDARDWEGFAACFDETVATGFNSTRAPLEIRTRDEWVAEVAAVLDGFTHTQHISSNHVYEFGPGSDRAICHSHMFAQHLLDGDADADRCFYLLRATYTNHMVRTSQ
ncbi:MAG TPA: nuclear transport factor 2 family protein [Microlunatus sp.]|nr:nuclear transport factor 2 family protein [Microlunatus sp.]